MLEGCKGLSKYWSQFPACRAEYRQEPLLQLSDLVAIADTPTTKRPLGTLWRPRGSRTRSNNGSARDWMVARALTCFAVHMNHVLYFMAHRLVLVSPLEYITMYSSYGYN